MTCDIVILSKNRDLLAKCLASIATHVDRKSIGRVIVGWTGNDKSEEQDLDIFGMDVTIESLDHYHFASNNNYLVEKHCVSDAVLFMNDDVELVEDSVTKCLKLLTMPDVGTVGIKLLYLDRRIQHCGQFISVENKRFKGVGHVHQNMQDFPMHQPFIVAGNTGAFLMCRRNDFLEVGGFDEQYKHCFEDVQLNIQILKLRRLNTCNVTTWAWHAESQTRKQKWCKEDAIKLRDFVNANMKVVENAQ